MNADEVINNFKNAQLLLKFAFDPDQPRDENGKFASGGGGGGGKESSGKADKGDGPNGTWTHVDKVLNVLTDKMSSKDFEKGMQIVTELNNKGPKASQELKDKAAAFVHEHKEVNLQNTKDLTAPALMRAVPELPYAAAESIKIVNANAGSKDVIHLPRVGQIPHAAMSKLREIYKGRKIEAFDLRASQPGGKFQTKSQKAMTDVMFGKK